MYDAAPFKRCWKRFFFFFYIYIYAFSRHFYPKRLTLHSSYIFFYILSALAFPGNRTHDLGIASAMLYHLSYRKAVLIFGSKLIDSAFRHFRQDALNLTKRFNKVTYVLIL